MTSLPLSRLLQILRLAIWFRIKSLFTQTAKFGCDDRVSKFSVSGWAVQDGKAAEVTLSVGGTFIASAGATVDRPDLLVLGLPLRSGFIFEIGKGLNENDEVDVSFADGTSLSGSPKVLIEAKETVLPPKRRAGSLDHLSKQMVSGWAVCDDQPVEVNIQVNDDHVGSVKGNNYRPDLKDHNFSPEAGFLFVFPAELEEGDTVSVTFLDGVLLQCSPRTLATFPGLRNRYMPSSEPKDTSSPLIFLHIPKTAGTSLRRLIDRHSPDRLALYDGEIGDFNFLRAFRRVPPPSLIMGHIPYGTHNLLGVPPRYAAVFRDPYDRVVSFYRYCQIMPDASYDNLKFQTISEMLESRTTDQTNNHMCRICAGISTNPGIILKESWLLELALHNIDQYFAIIGTTERLDDFVARLGGLFGWPRSDLTRDNVTRGAFREIDRQSRSIIEEYNALDIRLYASVKAALKYS